MNEDGHLTGAHDVRDDLLDYGTSERATPESCPTMRHLLPDLA